MLRRGLMLGLLGAITILAAACGGGGGGNQTPTTSSAIGGTVSGLAGSGLVLQNNGGTGLTISANGSFTFPTPVAIGAAYTVTIASQPQSPSQTCTVANGSGQSPASGTVTNIAVTCTINTYHVGGTVSDLYGSGLTLTNIVNGEQLSISPTQTSFRFAREVMSGERYNVTVSANPSGPSQTCTVANGTAVIGSQDAADVAVSCSRVRFRVGGTVTGLAGSALTLRLNSSPQVPDAGPSVREDLTLTHDGTFSFTSVVPMDSSAGVQILVQPPRSGSLCFVSTGGGAPSVQSAAFVVGAADVNNIFIDCRTRQYTVGGNVSGLHGGTLMLQDALGATVSISADGPFALATRYAPGESYTLTVTAEPDISVGRQHCVVRGPAAGTLPAAANLTSLDVRCSNVARFAYATYGTLTGKTAVSTFYIDPQSGVLSLASSPDPPAVFGNRGPYDDIVSCVGAVAAHPRSTYLYVSNYIQSFRKRSANHSLPG